MSNAVMFLDKDKSKTSSFQINNYGSAKIVINILSLWDWTVPFKYMNNIEKLKFKVKGNNYYPVGNIKILFLNFKFWFGYLITYY